MWLRAYQSAAFPDKIKHAFHNVQDLFVPREHLFVAHQKAIDKHMYNVLQHERRNGGFWGEPFPYSFQSRCQHRCVLRKSVTGN